MKTTKSEIGKNRYRLDVEVPAEDLDPFLDRTYKSLAKEVRVPGFRPGKAPKRIIDQRLGKDFVRGEALKAALPEFYIAAVEESELDVVAPPEIDVKAFEDGTPLTFEAVVETRPTPVLKDYLGLEITAPDGEVSEDEVEEQLERLRVRFATLEVVERAADQGDFCLVDLTTTHHDEVLEGLTAKDLLIEVGADMVVPELDAELKGKRKGDILKVNCSLPEKFGDRAGLAVGMSVLVKEVKSRKLPELDDDFATTVSEFDTMDELRADIRGRMEESTAEAVKNAVRERVMDAFVDRAVEVDLPEGMVDLEVDDLVTNLARMLSAQGIRIEQYMEHENLDVDALRSRMRPQAERNIVLRLGLDAVVEAEGLEVTDQDRTEHVERLAQRVGRSPEEVQEALDEEGEEGSVDGDILRAKALDLLVDRAQIAPEEGTSS